MHPDLLRKREELAYKQRELQRLFEEAGPELDFAKIHSISGTTAQKKDEIKRRNTELNALGEDIEMLVGRERTAELGHALNDPDGPGYPLPGDGKSGSGVSFGKAFTESTAYKGRIRGSQGPKADLKLSVKEWLGAGIETKAVMSTTAGWAPQAIRSGLVVLSAQRPVQVLDILPASDTSQANVVYMEETTATSGAAEVAEGAAYAQSTLVLTERTSLVQKIGTFLPMTDEQMEDVSQAADYVNVRLPFFVRQRLDGQVITGNGTPPNLKGILNVAGIQTQAKGADPGPDAIFKAMVKVRLAGRAFPSAVIMHPTDWQNIRLLKTAEGVYVWGSPAEAVPDRFFGLPVAQSDALTQGTAITADFANFTALVFRHGLEVQVGYVNDDFSKGQRSVRADVRAAFVVYRGAAVCTVTGL